MWLQLFMKGPPQVFFLLFFSMSEFFMSGPCQKRTLAPTWSSVTPRQLGRRPVVGGSEGAPTTVKRTERVVFGVPRVDP